MMPQTPVKHNNSYMLNIRICTELEHFHTFLTFTMVPSIYLSVCLSLLLKF